MVMATFVAIFLVAVVYHVAGVGEAALEQQVMQDAADAVTFSSASVNSRGMNLLVIINRIMAAILAILVAVRLLEAILIVAQAAMAVLCAIPWTAAAMCPIASALVTPTEEISNVANDVEDIVNEVLPIFHDLAELVNEIVPYLAEAEAVAVSQSGVYNRPAKVGFVWPVFDGLPTKEGSFETLCEKATGNVTSIAFGYMPAGVETVIGALLETLATTFSGFFCGEDNSESSSGGESGGSGGQAPQGANQRISRTYPTEDHSECSGDEQNSGVTDWNYKIEDQAGSCNDEEGSAQVLCDCEGKQECETCSRYGCARCYAFLHGAAIPLDSTDQREESDGRYEKGLWTRRVDRWREYWDSGEGTGAAPGWRFRAWVDEDLRSLVQAEGDPCAGLAWQGSCSTGAPSSERNSSDIAEGDPPPSPPTAICSDTGPTDSYTDGAGTEVREMERVSWLYLHSCEVSKHLKTYAQGNPVSNEDGDKNPRELDMDRYPDESKMRGVVIGEGKSGRRTRGVGVAAKGADTSGPWGTRVSVAAAEYYSPHNDLWHIDWTARLIRFRFSYDTEGTTGEGGGGSEGYGGGGSGGFGGGGSGGGMGGGFGQDMFSQCMPGLEEECGEVQGALGLGENGGGMEGLMGGGSGGGMGGLMGGGAGGGMTEDLILH